VTYSSIRCKYLYCTLPHSIAVQITTMQLFILYITIFQCSTDHYYATIYIVHYHIPVQYRSLRCNYLYCTLPQSSAVQITTMQIFIFTLPQCFAVEITTMQKFIWYITTIQCSTVHYDKIIYNVH
jgi:hypothetical protein